MLSLFTATDDKKISSWKNTTYFWAFTTVICLCLFYIYMCNVTGEVCNFCTTCNFYMKLQKYCLSCTMTFNVLSFKYVFIKKRLFPSLLHLTSILSFYFDALHQRSHSRHSPGTLLEVRSTFCIQFSKNIFLAWHKDLHQWGISTLLMGSQNDFKCFKIIQNKPWIQKCWEPLSWTLLLVTVSPKSVCPQCQ